MADMKRFVIQARLLGLDKNATKRGRENEYAIDVVLSDESQYTMFRTLKEMANFHTKVMNKFKIESGYFKKEERVIPECPIKQTIFGPQRAIRDDKSFGRLLNHYLKEIPALPAAVVKSDLVTNFFSLKASDLDAPNVESGGKKKKSRTKVEITDDSLITGPLSLKSYYTVADFSDKKTKFSFKEGCTVQVIQKDPGGWWMIDAQGLIGWAPASYLVPVDETDLEEEAEENENLIEQERVGTRYISMSAYQASRDDELSFVRGAVVKVLKKYVDGWWLVRYNGGEGFVPGAMFRKFDKRQATIYVKKIKRNFSSRGTTRIVPTVKPQWMNSRHGVNRRIHTSLVADSRSIPAPRQQVQEEIVIHVPDTKPAQEELPAPLRESQSPVTSVETTTTFMAQDNFEENGVCIHESDMVEVLDESDKDWWYVMDSQGARGWAPGSYFKHVNGQVDISEDDSTPNNDTTPIILECEMNEDDMFDDLDDDMDSLDIEECYVAVRDYTKQDIDELDMFEGQVVCVIDDTDKDVWYVNADGQEGWVPAELLRLITEEDMESSRESTPADLLSSADHSEMSDDDMISGVKGKLKRRHRIDKLGSNDLSAPIRPRSVVINSRSPSPPRNDHHSPDTHTHRHRKRLQVSDGSSDSPSDTVTSQSLGNNASIMELERETREAERQAREAQKKVEALKERLQLARKQQQQ